MSHLLPGTSTRRPTIAKAVLLVWRQIVYILFIDANELVHASAMTGQDKTGQDGTGQDKRIIAYIPVSCASL
jgi:hypothetical protein